MSRLGREIPVLERRVALERQRTAALDSERERYQQALAIIADTTTRQLPMKPAKRGLPQITAYWNPKTGLVLACDNLPATPPGRILQLWIMPRDGAPVSAGVFQPATSGGVLLVTSPSAAMSTAKSLAITEEPGRGSPQPTSPPDWLATLK
jgi:hypothetical protein